MSAKEVQSDGITARFRDMGLAVKTEIASQLGLRSLQRGWKKERRVILRNANRPFPHRKTNRSPHTRTHTRTRTRNERRLLLLPVKGFGIRAGGEKNKIKSRHDQLGARVFATASK